MAGRRRRSPSAVRGAGRQLGGPLVILFILVPALGPAGIPALLTLDRPAVVDSADEAVVPVEAQRLVPAPDEKLDAAGFPLTDRTAAEPAKQPSVTLAASGKPGCVGSSSGAFTSGSTAGSTGDTPVAVPRSGGRRVPVSTASALTAALSSARPGDTIELADGRYSGKFVTTVAGTAANPITLVGSCAAVIDGGSGSGYALHLNGASYWRLAGFTITGADKGVMTDRTGHAVLSHLTVGNSGSEAVHFLNFSSNNVIQHSLIHHTGKTKPQFGEGVYFGSAKSNWGIKSGGKPDLSNGNRALNNQFRSTTAENIDAKEETSGGVIAGNSFDGSAISGQNSADSVVDVKGVRYRVVNNRTSGASSALKDLIQTHVITQPATSGCNNTFAGNTFTGSGFTGNEVLEDKKCTT